MVKCLFPSRFAALASIVVLSLACRTSPERLEPDLHDPQVSGQWVRIRDRPVLLSVGTWTSRGVAGVPDGEQTTVLSMIVDGFSISFHATQGPYRPIVRGDAVHYGGHVFALTEEPGRYLVDGHQVELPIEERRVGHLFAAGTYVGAHPF